MNIRNLSFPLLVLAGFMASPVTYAQKAVDAGSGSNVVYRCPNNIYTNDPVDAKAKNCTIVPPNISTIGEAFKPAQEKIRSGDNKVGDPSKNEKSARNGNNSNNGGTSSGEQKARDSDRRKILEDELKGAESKLADLKKEYNNGEPERRGDERNFSKYQERVSQMKADVGRAEADVGALKREIGNLKE